MKTIIGLILFYSFSASAQVSIVDTLRSKYPLEKSGSFNFESTFQNQYSLNLAKTSESQLSNSIPGFKYLLREYHLYSDTSYFAKNLDGGCIAVFPYQETVKHSKETLIVDPEATFTSSEAIYHKATSANAAETRGQEYYIQTYSLKRQGAHKGCMHIFCSSRLDAKKAEDGLKISLGAKGNFKFFKPDPPPPTPVEQHVKAKSDRGMASEAGK